MASRAEHKAETHEALLRAALASYAERGLDGESLDAVCARAGLTRGAFYVHFADRDALLAAVMARVLDAFLATVVRAEGAAPDGEAKIEATIRGFTDLLITLAARPELGVQAGVSPYLAFGATHFHLVLTAVRRSPAVQASFAQLIDEAIRQLARAARAGQAAGALRRDVDAAPAGAALVALALGFMALHQAKVPLDLVSAREAIVRLALSPAG